MLETVLPDHERYLGELEELAPGGFFLGLGLHLGKPQVMVNRFPEPWVRHWEQDVFLGRDPIALWVISQANDAVARWSEISVPDNFGILEKACEHGLCYGATLVTRIGRRRSCLSAARPDREFTDAELSELGGRLNLLAHLFAKSDLVLTEKEIEALRQMKHGLTHTEAGESLGISASALKLRLSSAQKKLGCRNIVSAVARAVEEDLI
ncbi:autoinducer binding domain-containing protein [Paracoccus sp. MBLB3053]|uniref:Autoinducer binding domain-containing protein n=1 Tax=Paracoccus aurantius TaxID=3073814 RepID=A0ABU2HYV3_9RHOB|nr:autoinducer binding domain-containing protein [Paracoccus sp. MBLB3053]MDS9469680.1 autoinducer binding domain-containing protein [Paracoccus sp. MBLB3053]